MTNNTSPDNISLEFQDFLTECQTRNEQALENWLPPATVQPQRLHEAMRYAVLGSGKRIRPCLVYATGRALGIANSALDGPACSIELIHAYSLIHDDLPAMDNDDLRRGKATCHIAFDEATALLAGDALQSLAIHILAHDPNMIADPARRLRIIDILTQAIGSRGMAGGQAIDLESVGKQLDLAQLENMHIHKTGKLIHASVNVALLSDKDTDPHILENLDHYSKCIGLAFQIHDDILDVEGDVQELGKNSGSDTKLNKPTYPSLLGISEAKKQAEYLRNEALECLSGFDHAADPLRWIADYITSRQS